MKKTLTAVYWKLIFQSIIVGALVGVVIGAFRWGLDYVTNSWLKIFANAHENNLWFVVIIIGFILISVISGLLVKKHPHVGGSGIPEVKLELAGKLSLSWWPTLWRKFIGGILTIGSGLFLGPEGPSLQMGAMVGKGVAQGVKQSKTNTRVLLASGSASGLAAAFGAPLAGSMFILEAVFRDFAPRVWMTSLAGAIAANFVVSNMFGQHVALPLHYDHMLPLNLYWHLVILGLLIGILGHLYKIGLFNVKKLYAKITFLPSWLYSLIPLAILIPIAYYLPNITGSGSRLILSLNKLVSPLGWTVVGMLVAYYLIRLVFSIVSYDSGVPSGVFLPVLTLGAVIGATYGALMAQLGLLPERYIINLIIFSLAGAFASVIHAPFTAILLIVEMVGSIFQLMPLAVVAFIALLIDDFLGGHPIYDQLANAMEKTNSYHDERTGRQDQITLPVYEDSKLVGKKIAEIKWPENTLVRMIRRNSEDLIPVGNTIIQAGDMLVIEVDEGERGKVYNAMKKLQGVELDG